MFYFKRAFFTYKKVKGHFSHRKKGHFLGVGNFGGASAPPPPPPPVPPPLDSIRIIEFVNGVWVKADTMEVSTSKAPLSALKKQKYASDQKYHTHFSP